MLGSIGSDRSRDETIQFLESENLTVNVDWKGYRTITNGTREIALGALAKNVYQVYENTIANYALDKEDSLSLNGDYEKREEIAWHFNRMIELYGVSETSRSFIERVIYRIIRIFADWSLHTNLKRCEKSLKALGTFEESFRKELLPFKYRDAKVINSKDRTFFTIPGKDLVPILQYKLEMDELSQSKNEQETEINQLISEIEQLRGATLEEDYQKAQEEVTRLRDLLEQSRSSVQTEIASLEQRIAGIKQESPSGQIISWKKHQEAIDFEQLLIDETIESRISLQGQVHFHQKKIDELEQQVQPSPDAPSVISNDEDPSEKSLFSLRDGIAEFLDSPNLTVSVDRAGCVVISNASARIALWKLMEDVSRGCYTSLLIATSVYLPPDESLSSEELIQKKNQYYLQVFDVRKKAFQYCSKIIKMYERFRRSYSFIKRISIFVKGGKLSKSFESCKRTLKDSLTFQMHEKESVLPIGYKDMRSVFLPGSQVRGFQVPEEDLVQILDKKSNEIKMKMEFYSRYRKIGELKSKKEQIERELPTSDLQSRQALEADHQKLLEEIEHLKRTLEEKRVEAQDQITQLKQTIANLARSIQEISIEEHERMMQELNQRSRKEKEMEDSLDEKLGFLQRRQFELGKVVSNSSAGQVRSYIA